MQILKRPSLEFGGKARISDKNLDITGEEVLYNAKALFKSIQKENIELKINPKIES